MPILGVHRLSYVSFLLATLLLVSVLSAFLIVVEMATGLELVAYLVFLEGDPPYLFQFTIGVHALVVGIVILGLAWSPFAAIISARRPQRIVSNSRLTTAREAAFASTALLLPWIHYDAHLRGQSVPADMRTAGRGLVLLLWMLGPLLSWVTIWMIAAFSLVFLLYSLLVEPLLASASLPSSSYAFDVSDSSYRLIVLPLPILFSSIVAWLCVLSWWRSSSSTIGLLTKASPTSSEASSDIPIPVTRSSPFVLAALWSIAGPFLFGAFALLVFAAAEWN